jgi:hypothetical protein
LDNQEESTKSQLQKENSHTKELSPIMKNCEKLLETLMKNKKSQQFNKPVDQKQYRTPLSFS